MPCRRASHSPFPLSRFWRAALLGVGVLGSGALAGTAGAQSLQVCSGYGAGFMRMPNSDSCVKVSGGVEAQGFAGGSLSNNANPGSGMSIGEGTSPSSLASSSMSATTPSASPLSSLSSSGANAGPSVSDPWKVAR